MALINRTEVRGTFVKLKNGSIIEVEIDEHGNMTFIREVTPPEPSGGGSGSDDKEQQSDPSESESQDQDKSGEGEKDKDKGDKIQQELDEMKREQEDKARQSAQEREKSIEEALKEIQRQKDKRMAERPNPHKREDSAEEMEQRMEREAPGVYEELDTEKLKDGAFKAQLTSVMTDNKYDRLQRGRTRGKVDMTRLYKVKAKSNSVFSQKMSRKGKNYNVVLVLDESGSMSGHRILEAAEAILAIAKGFEGQVNLAIVGFNHFTVLHKDFDEPIGNYETLFKKMVWRTSGRAGGTCNHDYDALDYAYNLLKGRDGENLVLFMSDGAPATCGGEREREVMRFYRIGPANYRAKIKLEPHEKDEREHLHHLVKANEELATTIGLGIETKCWQIPDNIYADDADKLKPMLIDILRKKIKRG